MASTLESPPAIRPARDDDLPALTDIFNAAVTGTTFTGYLLPLTLDERRVWFASHSDPRYPLLVAERDGLVLGYACLSAWAAGFPVYAHTVESSLYLRPDAQGQGLGTLLTQALLTEAKRLGHHVVLARIWSGNAASIAVCRKCGYELVGVQHEVGRRHGVWEDCVVMQVIV